MELKLPFVTLSLHMRAVKLLAWSAIKPIPKGRSTHQAGSGRHEQMFVLNLKICHDLYQGDTMKKGRKGPSRRRPSKSELEEVFRKDSSSSGVVIALLIVGSIILVGFAALFISTDGVQKVREAKITYEFAALCKEEGRSLGLSESDMKEYRSSDQIYMKVKALAERGIETSREEVRESISSYFQKKKEKIEAAEREREAESMARVRVIAAEREKISHA